MRSERISLPFVSDTSSKSIDREGLGIRRTGTFSCHCWISFSVWCLNPSSPSSMEPGYNRMLRAILNISWRQHPTKLQLHGPIPNISTIVSERRMRFAGHCWRAKQELAIDLLLWSPNHGKRRVDRRPAITYIDQLCRDARCLPNDLPALLQDRDGRSDRLMNASASSTWWWKKKCTNFPFFFFWTWI